MRTRFIALSLLFAISCTKENINKSVSVAAQPDKNSAVLDSFYIGEKYGGGIIFYIDSTGQHGLIVAKTDQGYLHWYNGIYTVTGARGRNIGDGLSNTHKIIKSQGKAGSYAALACSKYKASGYTDWYLPAKEELHRIYTSHLTNLGLGGTYWSSTEVDSLHAYNIFFGDGAMNAEGKNFPEGVRAIRSF
jgi:hypothetical protein